MVAISAVESAPVANTTTVPLTATTSCKTEWADRPLPDVICLFDVDGTLSPSRKVQ